MLSTTGLVPGRRRAAPHRPPDLGYRLRHARQGLGVYATRRAVQRRVRSHGAEVPLLGAQVLDVGSALPAPGGA